MWRHPGLFFRSRMFGLPSPWRPLRCGPEMWGPKRFRPLSPPPEMCRPGMWGPKCGTRMWRPSFGPRMCCQSQCEMRKPGMFGPPPPMMPRCHTPWGPRMCGPQMRFNEFWRQSPQFLVQR